MMGNICSFFKENAEEWGLLELPTFQDYFDKRQTHGPVRLMDGPTLFRTYFIDEDALAMRTLICGQLGMPTRLNALAKLGLGKLPDELFSDNFENGSSDIPILMEKLFFVTKGEVKKVKPVPEANIDAASAIAKMKSFFGGSLKPRQRSELEERKEAEEAVVEEEEDVEGSDAEENNSDDEDSSDSESSAEKKLKEKLKKKKAEKKAKKEAKKKSSSSKKATPVSSVKKVKTA